MHICDRKLVCERQGMCKEEKDLGNLDCLCCLINFELHGYDSQQKQKYFMDLKHNYTNFL